MVEIDTLWNVKCVTGMTLKDRFLVEIDTLWNVKAVGPGESADVLW